MKKLKQTNKPANAPAANSSTTQIEPPEGNTSTIQNPESVTAPDVASQIDRNDMNQLIEPDQATVTEDSPGELEQEDLRDRLVAELADVEADIHFLSGRKSDLQKRIDAFIEEAESPDDHLTNTRNIQTYIQNQNARRRGEEIPVSPIDKVMARRRGYGLNRPKFPVKG